MRIFLIGFMGSGKSTMGGVLSRKLGSHFVDLDAYIVKHENSSVEEIFATKGEDYFRDCECRYLRQVCQEYPDVVISTGGGTPCKSDNMDYMRSVGVVVYLKTEPGVLCSRLINSKTVRPLIVGKTREELLEYIKATLAQREKFYIQANFVVANAGRDADKIINLINYKP